MLTIFGQWVDHDLTLTPFSPSIRSFSNGLNCDESCERSEPCFPIPVSQGLSLCQWLSHSCSCIITVYRAMFNVWIQAPPGDQRLRPNTCLPVFRSSPACGSGNTAYMFGGNPKVREQINALTAFLDGGQVYGSEDGLAKELRDHDQWWWSSTCQWSVPWQWTRAIAFHQCRKQHVCLTQENPQWYHPYRSALLHCRSVTCAFIVQSSGIFLV